MTITETTQYIRTKKKILKRFILKKEQIETTLALFQKNPNELSLHYKKMSCKKDKNRYSIRVLNTQYRILMTVEGDNTLLACVCDHDMRNKGC